MTTEPSPETARQLLWRHGLPEDVLDGALALHAQELAGKIRAHRDRTRGAVQATKVMDFAACLIDPASDVPGDEPAVQPPAVWEQCGRSDSGSCVEDDPRNIAAVAAAVSVPPPAPPTDTDRRARYAAAIAEGFRAFDADTTSDAYLDAEMLDAVVAAADAEQAVTRTAACRDAADAVARLKDLTDASVPEYQRYDFRQRCALGDAESVLRAMATEAQSAAAAPPESCAHCGKPVRLITGTLTAWWVHDPGGHTICVPGQAVSSPRATPKAAAGERQDGAQP